MRRGQKMTRVEGHRRLAFARQLQGNKDHWYKIQPNDPITEAVMEQSRFAQQNAERMIESANFGLTWTREFAEQTLNQSKAALDAFLKASNKIAKTFEGQSSAVREQTTVLT